MFWLAHIVSCWIPIGYSLRPPYAVDADEVLAVDERTGVRYPKPGSWAPTSRKILGRFSDHLFTMTFLYTVICFAGSWLVMED